MEIIKWTKVMMIVFFKEGDNGAHEEDKGEEWNDSAIGMKKLAKNAMNMLKTKANFEGDDGVAVMVDAIVNAVEPGGDDVCYKEVDTVFASTTVVLMCATKDECELVEFSNFNVVPLVLKILLDNY
ncbi:hypothetical protein PIB30_023149 [Stylosanthes scabra]|uniref:Uncharacterized protein n=1 Tax=Stylosanthes scabra TaxID=79078 RepID=A0ABU6R9N7_9FABA|nr:hypothetical protein [Stylosanthes scabra]